MSEIVTGRERRGLKRIVYGATRRAALRTDRFWERVLGLHVVPVRYDDAIPRVDELSSGWWRSPQELPGIDLRVNEQLQRLREWGARYAGEWTFPIDPVPHAPQLFYRRNQSYGNGDAEILWSTLRAYTPSRVLELGSGLTTRLAVGALELNRSEGHPCEVVSYDPYAGDVTRAGLSDLSRLVLAPAQSVPLDEFRSLAPNDVLLIDSSHMFKVGSDVAYVFEQVLPRLPVGVLVHFHDIYLPRPYPADHYRVRRWFWNEQNVLRVYLAENPRWRVIWSVNTLYRDHFDALAAVLPYMSPGHHGPCSFWMQRVAPGA